MKGWVLGLGLVVVSVALGLISAAKPKNPEKPFDVPQRVLMDPKKEKPVIWLFYNDTDVNSRFWSDFGARSSRVLNRPYMNLCYETIIEAAGSNYRVEIIQGLSDAISRLGGEEMVPSPLRNSKAMLKEEEAQFLAIAFLSKFGGLWISPSTICIRSIPVYPENQIIGFGTSDTETYSGPAGTPVPNTHYIWCPKAGTPVFTRWAAMLYKRIDSYEGGFRARRDNQWDWTYVTTGACSIIKQPNATLQRKANGRRIELDDLFASRTEGDLPFDIGEDVVFVPIPYYELDRRSSFQWFLRLSEEQIMESDIAVKYLYEKGLALDLNQSSC